MRAMILSTAAVALSSATDPATCWHDPATPDSAKTIKGSNGKKYSLIFSDEFDSIGREFGNGKDSRWTALEIGDTSNKGTAFYLPEQATIQVDTNVTGKPITGLVITTENKSFTGDSPTGETGVYMPYRSAMLQTWNKVCVLAASTARFSFGATPLENERMRD